MAKGAEIFKQLIMRGFPEETATRIVSGDLDMNTAQRVGRGQERFDMDSPLYHGGSSDFTEFDAELTSTYGDFGKGIYMSDSPQEVSDFYAGPSEFRAMKVPMQEEHNAKIFKELSHEELIAKAEGMTSPRAKKFLSQSDLEHMDKDTLAQELAYIEAKDKLVGDHAGAMYELVIDKDGVVDINDPIVSASEAEEYYQLARQQVDEMSQETLDMHFEGEVPTEDDIEDLVDYAAAAFAAELNPKVMKLRSDAAEMGIDLMVYPGETNWTDIRHDIATHINDIEMQYHRSSPELLLSDSAYQKLPKNPDFADIDEVMRDGPIAQELMKGLGIKGVRDTTAASKFRNQNAALNYRHDTELGNHTIMFPGSENQIRSPQAAFDPEYKGGNMLGNADPRMLTGVAAAGIGGSALLNNKAQENKPQPSGKVVGNLANLVQETEEQLAAATAVQQRGTITNTPMTHREQAKQAWVEQALKSGAISSNHSGQKLANSMDFAADFVPFLGGAAGATDTYDSTVRGHLGQAAIDAGTTLVGAIPGVRKVGKASRGMFDAARRKASDMKQNRSAKIMADIVEQATKD
jgi:hypothetical protein